MKKVKRILSMLLVIMLLITAVPLTTIPKAKAATTSYQVGDIIKFGYYPQGEVTDESTLLLLNETNTSWNSYGYYTGTFSESVSGLGFAGGAGEMAPSDFMEYRDTVLNGNVYRAVRFSKYRPTNTGYRPSASASQQDDNGYFINNTYWFEYEPIVWRILNPSTGLIMSETILDSQAHNNYAFKSDKYDRNFGYYVAYGDPEKTYAVTDYAKCSLRDWLLNDFYNTAFNTSQKNIIKTTYIDNKSTQDSQYNSSSNTNDKVFLLSYWDLNNANYGFSSSYSTYDTARQTYGSDYAKAQGLVVESSGSYQGKSPWRLRSPSSNGGSSWVNARGDNRMAGSTNACTTSYGIRPAMCIDLSLFNELQEPLADEYENETAERLYILGKGLTSYKAQNHLDYGESYQLEVFHYPSMEQINTGLTWFSSDSAVASVNTSGIVTGHKKGYAYIYAATASGLQSRHGYFIYVGDYKITGSEPDEFIYFAQNNNLSVADAAYVDLHLTFINSRKYEDRMNNRWGKYLGEEIIGDQVGTVAEFFYQVVNTATEIANCETLSQFENPYIVILADFMMNQSVGDSRVDSAYEVFGTKAMKAFKVIKKYFQTSDAWASEWEASTDIKKIIEAVKKDYSNAGLYKVLQDVLGDIISETGLNDMLASVDMLDGLMQLMSNFGDVVDWFYECYNFTLSVSAYIDSTDEFKEILKNVGKAAEQNGGTYYNQLNRAINSYVSVLTPDDIADAMLKKFASEGAKTLYNMIAGDIVDSIKVWITQKAGLSKAAIAKLSQAEFWATFALNTGWKIGNWATDNDGAVAAREMIRANHSFEHLLFLELKNREMDLRSKQTYKSALAFDAAYQMLKCSELYALDQSQKYIDSIDNLWNYMIHGFSAEKYADQRSFSVAQIAAWKLVNCHTNAQINDYLDRYQYYSKQKVVRVACPTDVVVKNANGDTVLQIENNEIVSCANDVTASVSGDIKYFSVTDADNYSIQITATDNGSMDYKVDEYTDLGEYLGSYTNEKITIVKEDTFDGTVNNTDDDNDYSLTSSNETVLAPLYFDVSSKIDVTAVETVESKTLKYGEETFLSYTVLPENASTKTVTITSSNTDVVEIGVNGKLKAVGEGNATVTVTALDGGVSAKCLVAVTHNYGPWTKLNDNLHQRVCANDPTHIETANHSWNAGVVTKAATCKEAGIRTHTCADCSATKTEAIPVNTSAHSLTFVPAKAATTESEGNLAYFHCTLCSKNFSDQNGTQELAKVTTDKLPKQEEQKLQKNYNDCKYCGEKHTGAFGWLIKFFHSILALFGMRK